MKIINWFCFKCKKLSNGEVLYNQLVGEKLNIVRFKMECCKIEYVKFLTENEVKQYIKEVK